MHALAHSNRRHVQKTGIRLCQCKYASVHGASVGGSYSVAQKVLKQHELQALKNDANLSLYESQDTTPRLPEAVRQNIAQGHAPAKGDATMNAGVLRSKWVK